MVLHHSWEGLMQTLEVVNSGEDKGILVGICSTQTRYKIWSGAVGEMTENSHIQTKGVRCSGLQPQPSNSMSKKCWNIWGTTVPQVH